MIIPLSAARYYVMIMFATHSRTFTLARNAAKLKFEPFPFVFFASFSMDVIQYVETVESPMFSFHNLLGEPNTINLSFF